MNISIKNDILNLFGDRCFTENIDDKYCRDYTEDLNFLPALVVLPKDTSEIQQLMYLANSHQIPVTVRGAGTGLAGGSLPVKGGILISMELMNKIIDIDTENLQVTTEPGVITEHLQQSVEAFNLYYPPDPSSKGISYIGGNISTNAGGPRAVKYGVVKDYVLNLEVILPNGETTWTGSNTLKNSTGYNLTQLLVGSEGTLGIVTKIVLRLIPKPKANLLLLAAFDNIYHACDAVSAIFRAGITPSAIEFMERDAIDFAIQYIGETPIPIADSTQAHLLIEVDGNYIETLYSDCEIINEVLEKYHVSEVHFADSQQQKDSLWKLRRNVGHAVKLDSIYKEEDTVVPRAALAKLLAFVKKTGITYGFRSVCYGHAGDGNLHVNILKGQLSEEVWNDQLPYWIAEIFEFVKSLGGTISGEHGIGWVQKRYMPIVFSKMELLLMKDIKRIFDPNNILNPDKIFP